MGNLEAMDNDRRQGGHRPPILDMTPEGEFRDPAPSSRRSWLDRALARVGGLALLHDLAQAVRGGEVRGFYLLAPAGFLAELKAALPNDVKGRLVAEHGADLTQLPKDQLFARLDTLRREAPEGVPADAPAILRNL